MKKRIVLTIVIIIMAIAQVACDDTDPIEWAQENGAEVMETADDIADTYQ